jgi:hypothetical protein
MLQELQDYAIKVMMRELINRALEQRMVLIHVAAASLQLDAFVEGAAKDFPALSLTSSERTLFLRL